MHQPGSFSCHHCHRSSPIKLSTLLDRTRTESSRWSINQSMIRTHAYYIYTHLEHCCNSKLHFVQLPSRTAIDHRRSSRRLGVVYSSNGTIYDHVIQMVEKDGRIGFDVEITTLHDFSGIPYVHNENLKYNSGCERKKHFSRLL